MFRHYFVCLLVLSTLIYSVPVLSDMDIEGVPLPEDVSPIRSDAAGSPFAGIWMGGWDDWLKTVLVVESIDDKGKASIVYGIADNPRGGFKAQWFRRDAQIVGDVMTLSDDVLAMSFTLSNTGNLKAVFGGGSSFGILVRQNNDVLKNPDAKIAWTSSFRERLKTDLVEDGKPINLQAIIFKPKGDGPFPLAVINHGSTGGGNDPLLFTNRWSNQWLAEVLNERGWIVVFPQRRGRGNSDGLYDEGFDVDRSKGYTCDAERSLAGADRALDDVDAAIRVLRGRADVSDEPILLAGASRGGILSIAYAGLHPQKTKGVLNFVGGWIGDDCDTADEINQTLFKQGAAFKKMTVWLYGKDDSFYSMEHSRKNFDAYEQAGGKGRFLEMSVWGNGHWVLWSPPLWENAVFSYLDEIEK